MPKAKKNYSVLIAIIGLVATVASSLVTAYFSRCDEKPSVTNNPSFDIKTDSSPGSIIAPVIQQNDKGKNELNQDFSKGKKVFGGDEVKGDKIEYNDKITRGGETTTVNVLGPAARTLSREDKDYIDLNILGRSKVVIGVEESREAIDFGNQIGQYLQVIKQCNVTGQVFTMIGLTGEIGKRFYIEKTSDSSYSIGIKKEWDFRRYP